MNVASVGGPDVGYQIRHTDWRRGNIISEIGTERIDTCRGDTVECVRLFDTGIVDTDQFIINGEFAGADGSAAWVEVCVLTLRRSGALLWADRVRKFCGYVYVHLLHWLLLTRPYGQRRSEDSRQSC